MRFWRAGTDGVIDLRAAARGLAAPLALYAGLVALLGFWGVNIEDGGLILAQGHRILLGEIPHRDFISPRPAGSAFLHLIDFALPLPLLLASKLVTLAEFVVAGFCFSLFIFRKRLAELTFAELGAAVVATLVGIEQFPIVPFYTIDGLMLLGAGFLLVQRSLAHSSLWRLAAAFGLLGLAATTKQSFWFAPFFGLAVVMGTLVVRRLDRTALVRAAAMAIAASALAPALYVGYVAIGGGWTAMSTELLGTHPVYGVVLLSEFRDPRLRADLLPSLIILVALLAVAMRQSSFKGRAAAGFGARVAATIIVLAFVLSERLVSDGNWAQRVFWCVVAVALLRTVALRRVDVAGLTVAFVAWMVTLSWGTPTPGLAAGACAAYLGAAIWCGAPLPRSLASRPWIVRAAVTATVLTVAVVFVHVRLNADYGVLRSSETTELGGGLDGVRMNAETAAYFRGVEACVARHPARWTAVVPEGALTYPILNLRNPFPIDWFWHDDYAAAGDRARLVRAAASIDARGDYLVLFQTSVFGRPAPSPRQIAPFFSDPPLAEELVARLRHGQRSNCGPFVAFYDPARAAPPPTSA